MCCSVAAIPESAALFLLLQCVHLFVLICRGSKARPQTEQLVLKCASLLLTSNDSTIRLLCAKSFYRCRLYRKCISVLDSVKPNGDAELEATLHELRHLAEQAEKGIHSIDQMKLDEPNPSYFNGDGGTSRLLCSSLSEEELVTEESLLKEKLLEGKTAAEQASTVESGCVPLRIACFCVSV